MEHKLHNEKNVEASNIKESFNHFGKLAPLLVTNTFQTIMNHSGCLSLGILEAAIALLVKSRIGFDVNYTGGDNRTVPSAQLVIYITPTVSMTFVFYFAVGDSSFGGKSW